MKPIGIGQIGKAKRRLSFETVGTSVPIKAATAPTRATRENAPEEQEGQLSVDVYQDENDIVILAPMAGTPAEEVHISLTDDVITIKGRREMPLKRPDQNDYTTKECFWGNFSRSIILPVEVDAGRVQARFKNNILTIRIPKVERVRSRTIKIEQE